MNIVTLGDMHVIADNGTLFFQRPLCGLKPYNPIHAACCSL